MCCIRIHRSYLDRGYPFTMQFLVSSTFNQFDSISLTHTPSNNGLSDLVNILCSLTLWLERRRATETIVWSVHFCFGIFTLISSESTTHKSHFLISSGKSLRIVAQKIWIRRPIADTDSNVSAMNKGAKYVLSGFSTDCWVSLSKLATFFHARCCGQYTNTDNNNRNRFQYLSKARISLKSMKNAQQWTTLHNPETLHYSSLKFCIPRFFGLWKPFLASDLFYLSVSVHFDPFGRFIFFFVVFTLQSSRRTLNRNRDERRQV